MIGNILKEPVRLIKTARLYARIGLKGITPLRAYRMLRYWVLTAVLKRKIPWLIELSVTYRCQCTCKHCSVAEYLTKADKKAELTDIEIRNVLEQAAKMGIPKIDYFGGEPLLQKDIVDLVKFGAIKGLYMSITTNGCLLTGDMVKKLKRAGISCVNVSLDSISEQVHDKLRGLPGLYKKATDGIKHCYKEGIPCIVSAYVTHNRIKTFASDDSDQSELTKIISLARELKASAIRILFPIISGKWARDKRMKFTREEERKVIDNIDPSFAFIEGAYSIRNGKKVCQALSGKTFNISPYGDIQLCIVFPDVFGNVKNAPLKDLVREMWNHPIYLKNKNGDCCSTFGLKR